jgi:hypothetical protein
VNFGLRLVGLLRQSLADLARAEKDMAQAPEGRSQAQARQAFLKQRSFVQYLCNCAGNLRVPVSADALADLSRTPAVSDPKTNALLQRQAVWSLAALGENRRRFAKLPEERQEEVLRQLDAESDAAARRAADSLRGRGSPAAVEALLTAATADDPFLRKLAAHALTFWDGPPSEERRIEDALVRLAHDDGHGTSIEIGESD